MKYFAILLLGVVLMFGMANAQSTNQTSVQYLALITGGNPLTIEVGNDVAYEALRPGVCYQTVADPSGAGTDATNIIPYDVNNPAIYVPALLNILGDANSEIQIDFVLPSRLYPVADGLGYIDMTYDARSGSWQDAGAANPLAFFNPQDGLVTRIAGDGALMINFGGNPCVSPDAKDEGGSGYQNDALVTVQYTGSSM